MIGVILAAGRGSRLGEIGSYTSKPALPLLGKSLLRHVHETMVGHFDSIIVVVNPQDHHVKKLLANTYWKEAQVEIVEQAQPLGSADALRHAWPHLTGACVVTGCDNIVPSGFMADFCTHFESHVPDALIATQVFTQRDGMPASVVQTDRAGRVTKIIEKPGPGQLLSDRTALPLYGFQGSFYQDLEAIELSDRNEYEIPVAIQNLIDRGGVVTGMECHTRITINSPEEYLAAIRNILMTEHMAVIKSKAGTSAGFEIQEPVYIEENVWIGSGAIIGPNAYLVAGSRVGEGARVRDSVVFAGSAVGRDEIVVEKLVLPDVVIDLQKSRGSRDLIHHP